MHKRVGTTGSSSAQSGASKARVKADRLRVGSADFFHQLGRTARSSGTDRFYGNLAELISRVVGCDRWLVMRYSQYAMPEFVVNRAMSDDAVAFYLHGLYRLDPLLRLWRSRRKATVVTLSGLKDDKVENRYFDDLFRTALIYDELAILLPAPSRICIAICCDRASRRFNAREIEAIETMYPTLEGLHAAHLERMFGAVLDGALRSPFDSGQKAMLIVDRNGRPVFRSEGWRTLEQTRPALKQTMRDLDGEPGLISLGLDLVLHWEDLPCGFAVAPEGRLCVVEERSPGYGGVDYAAALERFAARFELTPREIEIVALITRGYPNALISRKLRISTGTVRNHRYRLYFKLDITTERELFSLFLQDLFWIDPATNGAHRKLSA